MARKVGQRAAPEAGLAAWFGAFSFWVILGTTARYASFA